MRYEEGVKIKISEKDDQGILDVIEYLIVRDNQRFLLVNCFTYESSFSFEMVSGPEEEFYDLVNKTIEMFLKTSYSNENYIIEAIDLRK